MDTRTSFLWISVCVCLVSGESVFNVSGEVGSTAVLPCKLETVDTETPHIRWLIKSETVFERKGNESYQGVGYEGRVDVPEEELRKGDCSLVLENLTLKDKDIYTGYQAVRRIRRDTDVHKEVEKISSVYLSVREKTPEEKSDKAAGPTEKSEEKKYGPLAIIIPVIIVCGVLICPVIYIWRKDQGKFSTCRDSSNTRRTSSQEEGTVDMDLNQQANQQEYEMQENISD